MVSLLLFCATLSWAIVLASPPLPSLPPLRRAVAAAAAVPPCSRPATADRPSALLPSPPRTDSAHEHWITAHRAPNNLVPQIFVDLPRSLGGARRPRRVAAAFALSGASCPPDWPCTSWLPPRPAPQWLSTRSRTRRRLPAASGRLSRCLGAVDGAPGSAPEPFAAHGGGQWRHWRRRERGLGLRYAALRGGGLGAAAARRNRAAHDWVPPPAPSTHTRRMRAGRATHAPLLWCTLPRVVFHRLERRALSLRGMWRTASQGWGGVCTARDARTAALGRRRAGALEMLHACALRPAARADGRAGGLHAAALQPMPIVSSPQRLGAASQLLGAADGSGSACCSRRRRQCFLVSPSSEGRPRRAWRGWGAFGGGWVHELWFLNVARQVVGLRPPSKIPNSCAAAAPQVCGGMSATWVSASLRVRTARVARVSAHADGAHVRMLSTDCRPPRACCSSRTRRP